MVAHSTSRIAAGLVRPLAVLLLALSPVATGAQGRIAGRTIGTAGGAVANTRVIVVGTNIASISDGNGDYSIPDVPAGSHTVRTVRLGYQAVVTTVSVTNGATTVVNLVLVETSSPIAMVSENAPTDPLPEDSLRMPVPDSAIIRRRQAMGLTFDLRIGQRGVLALFSDIALTLLVTSSTATPLGVNASGSLLGPDGAIEGSFVIVMRNNTITANIRHGLRLYQIRHQLRGVHLVVEVDQKKLKDSPGDDLEHATPNDSLSHATPNDSLSHATRPREWSP